MLPWPSRKRLSQLIIPSVVMLVLLYTGFQLVNGERGIFTWRLVKKQVEKLELQNIQLKEEVNHLEADVQHLKKPIDPDYMDELVRRHLPYGKAGDLVILVSPSGYGGSRTITGQP